MKNAIVFSIGIGAFVVALLVLPHLADAKAVAADGNPVGFDLTSQSASSSAAVTSGTGTCLTNHNCTRIEVHYLKYPHPPCPKKPKGVTCSADGKTRILPGCPTGAQCITLTAEGNRKAVAISQGDNNQLHKQTGISADVMVVGY